MKPPPPSHLRLVPEPTPCQRAAQLRVLIYEAADRYGPDSPRVQELKEAFDQAMRVVVAARKKGPGV